MIRTQQSDKNYYVNFFIYGVCGLVHPSSVGKTGNKSYILDGGVPKGGGMVCIY